MPFHHLILPYHYAMAQDADFSSKDSVATHAESSQEQFIRSYRQFADAIYRHCYFRISQRERAEELTQDTFLRAWKYIAEGGVVRNFRPFLYRIANNLIINEYRKVGEKKKISMDELLERGFEPSGDEHIKLGRRAEYHEIFRLLDVLDTQYREAVIMRYVDDLSPKEIAEACDETENVVSLRIHRGMKRIRKLLRQPTGSV